MSGAKTYWKTIPLISRFVFLLGVFCIFSTFGIASDILDLGRESTLHFVLGVLLSGLFSTSYALSGFILRKQFWKAFLPLFALHFLLIFALGNWLPTGPRLEQMNAADIARLQGRLATDAIATIVAVALGYSCFLYSTITEGRRYFREHAEIELAAEIHRVLVPAVDAKLGGYEFYGRSAPSGEVGGDLIDLAGAEDKWVAYVADVSGHGVAPGVVMGMVKSAARMLLSSGDDAGHLLPRLNEVLYPLKKPDMFVTFCFLARDGEGLRIGLAGHPAILHFSAKINQVTALECPNMPLGILPSADFVGSEIRAESGDVFALYTDGFLEPANAAGEEFGLARLQAEFQKHGREPLEAICKSLRESVERHGAQFDDQSLLLIRKT
ncbi:MAG TPA: PP2C family protein-serine/threonine phosphatase [Candidatus Acidoferrum sp.]|nr:PP2C family protein-serine/threonine phosphatase [Candidatus Acidoferrum sp.]